MLKTSKSFLKHPLFLPGLVVSLAFFFWLSAFNDYLWMDEFGTFWVTADGFQNTLARAFSRFQQSPFYYILVWINSQIVGTSEWALRLPSLAAIAGAVWFVFRTAEEFFDRESAALSAAVFVTLPDVFFSATSARPYALGLFASAWSMWAVVRWTRTGEWKFGVAYILSSALLFHSQWIFGVMMAVHFIYFVLERERHPHMGWGKLILAWFIVGISMLPLASQFLALWGKRENLSYLSPSLGFKDFNRTVLSILPLTPLGLLSAGQSFVSFREWKSFGIERDRWIYILSTAFAGLCHPIFLFLIPVQGLVFLKSPPKPRDLILILLLVSPVLFPLVYSPPAHMPVLSVFQWINFQTHYFHRIEQFRLILLPLAVVLGYFLCQRRPVNSWTGRKAVVLFAWVLFPALLVYAVSTFSSARIFYSRYFIFWTVGFSILLGSFVGLFEKGPLKAVFLVLLVIFAWLDVRIDVPVNKNQDWKTAARVVNEGLKTDDTPVLFLSGFIESKQMSWLTEPAHQEILRTPVTYYPVKGALTLLPFSPSDEPTRAYLENVTAQTAALKRDFVLYRGGGDRKMIDWIEGRVKSEGYQKTRQENLGPLQIAFFTYRG